MPHDTVMLAKSGNGVFECSIAASRRLRCCTTCRDTGKIRDRDVQGARNILWLTFALYYGLERPKYLRRGDG